LKPTIKEKKFILDGGFSCISLYDDLLATIHANLSRYLSEASNFGNFANFSVYHLGDFYASEATISDAINGMKNNQFRKGTS
jgi:hypothetical protein